LSPVEQLLRRYRSASVTIARLINALEAAYGEQSAEPADRPLVAHIGAQSGEIGALLEFQERLSELDGVSRVTIAGSAGGRTSFLVELSPEVPSEVQVECSVCGRVIVAGRQPPSHGLCDSCRETFGAGPLEI
jgi:hypothetical protein